MVYGSQHLMFQSAAAGPSIEVGILLFPIAFALWGQYLATHTEITNAASVWLNSRRSARVFRLIVAALWWVFWDFQNPDFFSSPSELIYFWLPPVLSVGISQAITASAAKKILRLKRGSFDMARLAFWSTVSPTAALLVMAIGAEMIYRGWWQGALIIAVSGSIALVATAQSRLAEGLQFRPLRAGRLHGRAFQIARKMSVNLEKVYIVPAGKGHLTNAYGLSRSIAVTDNYGKFADGAQLDFIIGHELIHVKERHGSKGLGVTIVLFFFLTLVSFILSPRPWSLRIVADLAFIFIPTLASCFVSRRFEYAADRGSVEFTADPETAIRALANLYRFTSAPIECSRTVELFMTHPSLSRRVKALACMGKVPSRRVDDLLRRSAGDNI